MEKVQLVFINEIKKARLETIGKETKADNNFKKILIKRAFKSLYQAKYLTLSTA